MVSLKEDHVKTQRHTKRTPRPRREIGVTCLQAMGPHGLRLPPEAGMDFSSELLKGTEPPTLCGFPASRMVRESFQ